MMNSLDKFVCGIAVALLTMLGAALSVKLYIDYQEHKVYMQSVEVCDA